MILFPSLGLYQQFYIGDNCLVEPIAAELASHFNNPIYVLSNYPEMFENHPTVIGVPLNGAGCPEDMRVIDMTASIQSVKESGNKRYALRGKVKRMRKAAGLVNSKIKQPQLYLSESEISRAVALKGLVDERPCVGVVLTSRSKMKHYPYVKYVVKRLIRDGYNVFIIGENIPDNLSGVEKLGAYSVVGKSIRELMINLSFMDVVVGPDTGPIHMAAALGTDIVVITRDFWKDIYDSYERVHIVGSKYTGKYALYTISPNKVLSAIRELLDVDSTKPVAQSSPLLVEDEIVLFRLDGLGGSLTLLDHAKKIYDAIGKQSVLVVRGNAEAFTNVPYIKKVLEVGYVDWRACLAEVTTRFDTVGEIRFSIARWHQKGEKYFKPSYFDYQETFDNFPDNCGVVEAENMHHILLTDKCFGLPFDTIEGEIHNYKKPQLDLPRDYILVNNGIDTIHKGLRQTKMWLYWDKLVSMFDMPVVQVGTQYDIPIDGTIDLRGKTSIAELFYLVKNATRVVCCEGGIMHVAYFTQASNVWVIRGPTRGALFEYPGHNFIDSYLCKSCLWITEDWYAQCARDSDAVCMSTITPERVYYNIQGELNENMVALP